MENIPKINQRTIADYVEEFIQGIFRQPFEITVKGNSYIANNRLRFPTYNLFDKNQEQLIFDFNGKTFNNDYITTIFFFLSGYWEYIHPDIKDVYGRFPGKKSFQYIKGILEEPIVDILVMEIGEKLDLRFKEESPKLFLTHDIDDLSGFLSIFRNGLGDMTRRRRLIPGIKKIFGFSRKRRVEYLLDLHQKYGTKGTFFFLPRRQPKRFEGGYDISRHSSYLRKVSQMAFRYDCSVGLHYDVRYLEKGNMMEDLETLSNIIGKKPFSGRAHYLLFDIRKSFDIYESSGIKLDSTGGYADLVGFRFGTSYPFKPFNFKTGKSYDLIEVPLIIMEGTLLTKKYMGFNAEQAFEKIKELIKKVKRCRGVFTFLWHNTSFDNAMFDADWLYYETVKYALENGFLAVNSDEIIKSFLEEG